MKTMKILYMPIVAMLTTCVMFTSCLGNGGETIPLEYQAPTTKSDSDIPSDDSATQNPNVESNTTIPNFGNDVVTDSAGNMIVEMYMPGIKYPNAQQWLYLAGTGGEGNLAQNLWISVDGTPKGCKVLNNSNGEVNNPISVDFVFLVDNSSNMNEVGDMIANDFAGWSVGLSNSNIDMRYACVGYGGSDTEYGVDGAVNLCSADAFNSYLNRESVSGVTRTKGYSGSDATQLQSVSTTNFSNCEGECGVEALRFADEMFSFRQGSCRVYINFTDEANQPGGDSLWSVEYVNNQTHWLSYKGSIHTVFSGNASFQEQDLTYEWPWKLSQYTGGTEYYCDNKLTGVSLDSIPVSYALKNYYVIKFKIPASLIDGVSHAVRVTVYSSNGEVQADKSFNMIFQKNS